MKLGLSAAKPMPFVLCFGKTEMEFINSIQTTGADIPKHMADYVIQVGEGR